MQKSHNGEMWGKTEQEEEDAEGESRDSGAQEKKTEEISGLRNDGDTKGEDGGREKVGGHVKSTLEKMEALLRAFIPLKQKFAIPYQYCGNQIQVLKGTSKCPEVVVYLPAPGALLILSPIKSYRKTFWEMKITEISSIDINWINQLSAQRCTCLSGLS